MTYFEPEFDPETPPVDAVYEADTNGNLIEMEVPNDATDD